MRFPSPRRYAGLRARLHRGTAERCPLAPSVLALLTLLAFVDVGPGDRAGRHCRYRIGHDADDAAELPPVQRVAGLVEVDCRMPADAVGPLEHVLNCAGDDLADVAEVSLAGRPKDGTQLEHDLPREYEGAGVAVIIARWHPSRPAPVWTALAPARRSDTRGLRGSRSRRENARGR